MQHPIRRRTILCLALAVFTFWALVGEIVKEPLNELMHEQGGIVRGVSRADRFQHFLQDTGSHVTYEAAKSSEEIVADTGYRGRFGQYLKLKESKDKSRYVSSVSEVSRTNGTNPGLYSMQS